MPKFTIFMDGINHQSIWMVYCCFTNIPWCCLLMEIEAMAFVPGDSVEDAPAADAHVRLPPRRPSLAWTNGDDGKCIMIPNGPQADFPT